MKKSEAIEAVAIALIFNPESVGAGASYRSWMKHLTIDLKPVCHFNLKSDRMSHYNTNPRGMEDFMSHYWSGEVCHNCSDIWREAVWKRNGMMAKTRKDGE